MAREVAEVLKHARHLTVDPRPLLGKTSMPSNDALQRTKPAQALVLRR
jgi:hypothetical protein